MVYGRAIGKTGRYGTPTKPIFHVFFTGPAGSATQYTTTEERRYRLHMYAYGGNGGNGSNGSQNAGGGGGSRGGIGITDIDLPAGAVITCGTTSVGGSSGLSVGIKAGGKTTYYAISGGTRGGDGGGTTGGSAGIAHPSGSTQNFNLIDFTPPEGNPGQSYSEGAKGGKASIFTGDLDIAKYTNHSTVSGDYIPPTENPNTWILGLGGDGGNGTLLANDPDRTGRTRSYGGVVLEVFE